MKICTECKENKPLTEFYSQKKQSKKQGEYIYYQPYCKECASKKSGKWQKDNHSHYLKTKSEYHKNRRNNDPEYRDYDRRRAKNQKESGYMRKYYLKNKEYFSNYQKERLSNKTHEVSDSEWTTCKQYFNNLCAYCGLPENDHYIVYAGKLKKTDLHKEHVDNKGSNKLDNCIPSCQKCNCSKWAFSLEEWFNEGNPNYNHERLMKIHRWLSDDYKEYINI